MPQTSQVLSQRHWPGNKGTINDCWVVATLAAVACSMPWLHLPGITVFRAAAGDPEDGVSDGGTIPEILRGARTTWPVLRGSLVSWQGGTWAEFVASVNERRPMSVAVWSADLPANLRYGFNEAHQVTLVKPGVASTIKFANPLAAPHSKWDAVTSLDVLKPAIMGYGRQRTGKPGVFAVAFPNDEEGFKLHPLFSRAVKAASDERVAQTKVVLDARTAALRAIAAQATQSADNPPTP